MNIEIEKEIAEEAAIWVSKNLSFYSSQPIYEGVVIETTSDDFLILKTFNQEIYSQIKIKANIIQPGKIIISAKKFADVCKAVKTEKIIIKLEEKHAKISGSNSKFELPVYNNDEYPDFKIEASEIGEIKKQDFEKSIKQVEAASAKNDEKSNLLKNINISFTKKEIDFIATDTFRIANKKIPWNNNITEEEETVLLQVKNIEDLVSSFETEEKIKISVSKANNEVNFIKFEANNKIKISKTVVNKYPVSPEQIKQMFIEEKPIKVFIERNEFFEVLKNIRTIIGSSVAVIINFEKNDCLVSAQNEQGGSIEETIKCRTEGENKKIVFNTKYLFDGISSFDNQDVILNIDNENKPVLLSSEKDSYKYTVVPIRKI